MQRIDGVRILGELLTSEDLVINRVGPLSDDWWNHRPQGADMAFAPVILGSITSTALGLALALPHRRVAAFDTDGSILMNTGILATLGNHDGADLVPALEALGVRVLINETVRLVRGNEVTLCGDVAAYDVGDVIREAEIPEDLGSDFIVFDDANAGHLPAFDGPDVSDVVQEGGDEPVSVW